MTSHKVVNANLTLADFLTSQRVATPDPTLFHVQDPEDGHWGVFETSRGLIIPCSHSDKPKRVEYGFWLLKTTDSKFQLWNPHTKRGTTPSSYTPRQIDAHHVITSNHSGSYLMDLQNMRVYGNAPKSELETQHLGFQGVSVEIPSTTECRFSALVSHGLLILVIYNGFGSIHLQFLMDLGTGKVVDIPEAE